MPIYESKERHPFISLIYLLLLILVGSVIFTIIGFGLGILIYGFQGIAQYQEIFSGSVNNDGLGFIKIIQTSSTIGMFIVPALVFARLESSNVSSYLHLDNRGQWILITVSIAVMFSSGPIIEWTVLMNKQMVLPEFLHGLQDWMLSKEKQLDRITKTLLIMNNFSSLLINLIMIAILPAIGEEFIFRGCFQNIFTRWAGNYHWGIWLAAILFSAIHAQFYGFIPRMLLGALFGYLLVWGRSIWLPVLAHFVNNAGAVITAYAYQLRGQSLDKLDQTEPVKWPVYLISAAMTALLLGYMYNKWSKSMEDSMMQQEK